jgi:hypothetical protein
MIPAFSDPNEALSLANFDALADALKIRWPDWYRELIETLLAGPVDSYGAWLPGGFLYRLPYLVYRDTTEYAEGRTHLNQWDGASRADLPWPRGHVIVGGYGDGAVVIDTVSDRPAFLNIYKEDYALRPFLDLVELGMSPAQFARSLQEGEERSKRERAERRRNAVNPIFRPDAS